ncbi:AraC family transcriptional regulator [uncultured Clostridium sp.]|uniref:AraC family transcriptional regulator n=1 Tax=uncultured Clostridium sp. TaxID=59620 RepID=UPI0028E83AA9|nr:AraC family transcriptional regulator [uncultured Clostridium sp.]
MFGLNNLNITINQHIFWDKKEHFLLDEDIDSNWVLYAIEDGECDFEISSHKGLGKFGDIIICPPGMIFKRKVINDLTFHFINFSIHNQDDVSSFPVGKISVSDLKRLNNTYYYLKLFCHNNNKELNQWKNSLISDIIKLYYIETQFSNFPKNFVQDELINYSLKYLNKNAYNSIKIKDLSDSLGLSSVQFTRRFKKCIGTTPIEYVTSLRLRRAQVLLLRTDDTLECIASKCGYDNGFYLSRVFMKNLKITPSNYRKKYK